MQHGGGYSYRLCPSSAAQTEDCFQRHHLDFVGNETTVRWLPCNAGYCTAKPHGSHQETIPAKDTAIGTTPVGSSWRRNPIPLHPDTHFQVPCKTKAFPCSGVVLLSDFQLVDRVFVPADLARGNYTLSWRWDTEQVSVHHLSLSGTHTDPLSYASLVSLHDLTGRWSRMLDADRIRRSGE